MEEELQKVVEEIEAEQLLGRVSAVSVFRSLLNQPDLLALSSVDADPSGSVNGFSSFQITLPRPMLEVDAIQLVHANIPQCVQNIPDTACVFWYYRLSSYTGLVPNARNLYFVRLLPSYYKPEFTPASYGQNKTFHSYQDVADELTLSCQRDLAFDHLKQPSILQPPVYKLQYLPGEIELSYNQSMNKFQMRGTNTDTRMAYIEWNVGTTYGVDAVVYFGTRTYISLKAGNTGNAVTSTEWWEQIYVDVVEPWDVTTPYRQGQYVAFNEVLYYAEVDVIGGNSPPTNASFVKDDDIPTDYFYRYLITGYNDPNVAQIQGTGVEQWNAYSLFEQGVTIQYQGQSWVATKQNKGYEPFSTLLSTPWNNTTRYRAGQVVVAGSPLAFYKATQNNINQTPSTFSTFWTRSYWSPGVDEVAIVGLHTISGEFDMVDTWDNVFQYPFPIGIPAQPFNPTPRRLLNSILGFTWNGILNPTLFPAIDGLDVPTASDTFQVELLNRIRPVPQYFKRFTTGLSTELTQSTDTQFYTAEGYCNLVYSSILSIYANVMGGSTINTNQNTGLLGLSSMNAGNLGVSFYSQPIVQPLSINGSDIYTIGLYFEDEFGEPYFFTNNAVLSFMLKITYKNKVALK